MIRILRSLAVGRSLIVLAGAALAAPPAAFGDSGSDVGQFRQAIAVAKDGAVFVAEFQNNRIQQWRPNVNK